MDDKAKDFSASVANQLGLIANGAGANENQQLSSLISLLATEDKNAGTNLVGGTPPRLAVVLNSLPVDYKTDPDSLYAAFKAKNNNNALNFAKPGNIELRFLINHIYSRLAQPFIDSKGNATQDSPWNSQPADLDEHWARRISEMLTLSPYCTPEVAYSSYSGPALTDEKVLYKMQDEADPARPIVFECQHTVTAAIQSRGFGIDEDRSKKNKNPPSLTRWRMFGANKSEPAVNGLRLRPLWHTDPEDPYEAQPMAKEQGFARWLDETTGTTNLSRLPADFGPGSAFVFNAGITGKQEKEDHPHTAFVIRVLRDQDNKLLRIQFFDVGGMNVREPKVPGTPIIVCPDQRSIRSYECPWSKNAQEGASTFCGLTSLSQPPNLSYAITQMAKTRPLGLARLVLGRRKRADNGKPVNFRTDAPQQWLLYASPLLRMYEDPEESNYAISRYVWSLRGMPGCGDLVAFWLIQTPRSELARAMAFGVGSGADSQPASRTMKLSQMVEAVDQLKIKGLATLSSDKPLPPLRLVYGVVDLRVATNGQVEVSDAVHLPGVQAVRRDTAGNNAHGAYALQQLPWGLPKTYDANVDLATFVDIPPYFTPSA